MVGVDASPGTGGHHHHPGRAAQSNALRVALIANASFMFVELVGGLAFNSLALLADAGHMLSDVAALIVALLAHKLVSRPPSDRHTFGLQRAEVVGAQLNGLILMGLAAWLLFESFSRLRDPAAVEGLGLVVVAVAGLTVNLGSAVLLHKNRGNSLNMRGALLHMTLDAVGSVAALSAGIGIVVSGADWLDPLASTAIAFLIVWSAWHLLRETTHVLLEGTPRGLEPARIEAALTEDPAVESIHHLHLWNLASDVPALSAHVVVGSETTLHDAQLRSDRLKSMLRGRFGIEHATLELECHVCEPEPEPAER